MLVCFLNEEASDEDEDDAVDNDDLESDDFNNVNGLVGLLWQFGSLTVWTSRQFDSSTVYHLKKLKY